MPKKIFDTLFIIDPNEKPAPSFLAVYIFTWFVLNKESTFKFIEAKGDFFVKLNAAIEMPITYNLWQVLGWTFALVVARFILNNIIYFCRESSDHFTQFVLNELNIKSFVKSTVHQKAKDDLAVSRAASDSLYDKRKAAEEREIEIKKELEAFKKETDTQLQDAQYSIKENEIEIDRLTKLNESSLQQLRDSNNAQDALFNKVNNLQNKNNELSEQSSANFNELQAKKTLIEKYIEDLDSSKNSVSKWQNDFRSVKNIIDIWSKNTNVDELKLLYKNDKEYTKADRTIISRLLNTELDFPEVRLGHGLRGLNDLQFGKMPPTPEESAPPAFRGLEDLLNKPPAVTAAGLGDLKRSLNKTKDGK